MRAEGKGTRTARVINREFIERMSTEEGGCLLWGGQVSPKGFPYTYVGSEKVNLRPYVYAEVHGKRLTRGNVVSVTCGHRNCLSDRCLVQKTVSAVRKAVHAELKRDPASYAKTRHGIQAAGLTKLNMTKAQEIRASNLTSKELAAAYGVTTRTIQEIRRGETYAVPKVANSIFNLAATMGVA